MNFGPCGYPFFLWSRWSADFGGSLKFRAMEVGLSRDGGQPHPFYGNAKGSTPGRSLESCMRVPQKRLGEPRPTWRTKDGLSLSQSRDGGSQAAACPRSGLLARRAPLLEQACCASGRSARLLVILSPPGHPGKRMPTAHSVPSPAYRSRGRGARHRNSRPVLLICPSRVL